MSKQVESFVTYTWKAKIGSDTSQQAFVKRTGNTVRFSVESRYPIGPLSSTTLVLDSDEFNKLVDSLVFIKAEIAKGMTS